MYLAELPWRRGCSVSEVPKEGSSVFSLFSLTKLHLASLPLASNYSHVVAVSSVFCAPNIFFGPNAWGPVKNLFMAFKRVPQCNDIGSTV